MVGAASDILQYEGCNFLRQRLILSTVSGRTIRINNIRNLDKDPGLKDFEVKLLKLFDAITNGTIVEINQSGTCLIYRPGLLNGGSFNFDCGLGRSISYFLETLLYLAPFVKQPIRVVFTGISNRRDDISVDAIKVAMMPILNRFVLNTDGLEITVKKRGLAPDGGAEVEFKCPICRELRPIQLTDQGKVKKIRGLGFACKVAPSMAGRAIEQAKRNGKKFISDVYLTMHHTRGEISGNSPGFGLVLHAETTTGVVYVAESTSTARGANFKAMTSEDVATEASYALFEQIFNGGCVDCGPAQTFMLYLISLTPKDVSKVVVGQLSQYSVQMLRHINDFLGVQFKIEEYSPPNQVDSMGDKNKLLLTCVGSGFTNINKAMI